MTRSKRGLWPWVVEYSFWVICSYHWPNQERSFAKGLKFVRGHLRNNQKSSFVLYKCLIFARKNLFWILEAGLFLWRWSHYTLLDQDFLAVKTIDIFLLRSLNGLRAIKKQSFWKIYKNITRIKSFFIDFVGFFLNKFDIAWRICNKRRFVELKDSIWDIKKRGGGTTDTVVDVWIPGISDLLDPFFLLFF